MLKNTERHFSQPSVCELDKIVNIQKITRKSHQLLDVKPVSVMPDDEIVTSYF